MLISSLVEIEAVNSIRESQRLRSASGWLFRRELTAAMVESGRLFGRESTAALVESGRFFRRESTADLKWLALWKRGVTAIGSLEERRDRALG